MVDQNARVQNSIHAHQGHLDPLENVEWMVKWVQWVKKDSQVRLELSHHGIMYHHQDHVSDAHKVQKELLGNLGDPENL